MTLLSKSKNIWELRPTVDDLAAGSRYASITLPWTFDRMMMNSSSVGQQSRALNIAKGIVGQEMLRRALSDRNVTSHVQRKSHRDEDLFDFNVSIDGKFRKLDVKSINYYRDYPDVGRSPLTTDLIVANAAYAGPDWRRFFPMLVPHTQIRQDKEAYCFAISSSIDFRQDMDTDRTNHAITAFPYGEPMPFLSSKRLCLERERVSEGFYINCCYRTGALLDRGELQLTVVGEWAGNLQMIHVDLKRDRVISDVGPFSCISSFRINRTSYETLYGEIEISVGRNNFVTMIYNTLRRNINLEPNVPLVLTRGDFCNLVLPTDYTMYVIGWLLKEEFVEKCRNYTGWIWPLDSANKYENQPWSQITRNDQETITRAGFADCIQVKPHLVKAGWMKTTGRGGGACCYVFPNVGYRGGVKETNLYVLPQDLHIMDELGTQRIANGTSK